MDTFPKGSASGLSRATAKAVRKTNVMFLCRSGVRSHSAAIAAHRPAGRGYNVLKDSKATRTRQPSQLGAGAQGRLPWVQI